MITLKYSELINNKNNKIKSLKLLESAGEKIYKGLLPDSLTHLIQCDMDASRETIFERNCFPASLISIVFNEVFNQPLIDQGILPIGIQSIDFGYSFNQSLQGNWLPKSLKHVKFGTLFQQPISGKDLPPSLQSLTLDQEYECKIDDDIPTHLKRVYTFNSYGNQSLIDDCIIPPDTMVLIFEDEFNQDIKACKHNDKIGKIPLNVRSIKFGKNFNGDIEPGSLPIGLKSIEFSDGHNSDIFTKGILPNNLETLILGQGFVLEIPPKSLPSSITNLDLGCCYEGSIDMLQHLPLLSTLKLNDYFDKPIVKGTIPNSVTSLSLPYYNDHPISIDSLPPSLKTLSITNPKFNQDLSIDGILPLGGSLETIYVSDENKEFLSTNLKLNKLLKLFK